MTTKVKVIISVAVVVVVVVIVYFLLKGTNKYASAESLKKAKSGTYGKWGTGSGAGGNDWFNYIAAANSLFGDMGNSLGTGGDAQAYASGWLRGMDLNRTKENLQEFQADIKKYVGNSSLRKPDWQVTTGSFLTA